MSGHYSRKDSLQHRDPENVASCFWCCLQTHFESERMVVMIGDALNKLWVIILILPMFFWVINSDVAHNLCRNVLDLEKAHERTGPQGGWFVSSSFSHKCFREHFFALLHCHFHQHLLLCYSYTQSPLSLRILCIKNYISNTPTHTFKNFTE